MTYNKLKQIKCSLLISFTILIFLHNFSLVFPTRNLPFFSIKTTQTLQFSQNKSKTEAEPNISFLSVNKQAQNELFPWHFTQAEDYGKAIQTRSASRAVSIVTSLFLRGKGLYFQSKVLIKSGLFSLKYRFFELQNALHEFRDHLVWLLEGNFPSRVADLGKAFVFAELSGAPEELYHSFKVIGILHLIAASSANIYLLLSFFALPKLFLEQFLSKKLALIFQLSVIWLYFYLVNASFSLVEASPSILRAALSVSVARLAIEQWQRPVQALNLLVTIAVICLLINPFYLQSLGFQLSYLATFILLFYWPYIQKNLAKSSLMLSLTVQFFLWPLLLFHFSSLNLIAIPANVLIAPLVELLSVLFLCFLVAQLLPAVILGILGPILVSLITIVSNIFFASLEFFGKMPLKELIVEHHKSLVTALFLLFDLALAFVIIRSKQQTYQKNKYKLQRAWSLDEPKMERA